LASSEGSNFSSFSMSGALGAVPRVVRDCDSLPLAAFARELFDWVPCERVVFEGVRFEVELRERRLPELVLREPEDLELPPDLLCAIPRPTIPSPRAARAACRRAETIV
jgi:hypothetical protein